VPLRGLLSMTWSDAIGWRPSTTRLPSLPLRLKGPDTLQPSCCFVGNLTLLLRSFLLLRVGSMPYVTGFLT
jgi:hypothetical protein